MNANNLGRLARIFESRGFTDRPVEGNVTVEPVMWGLGLYTAANNVNAEVSLLADLVTPEDAGRTTPLTAAEEADFWEGYHSQTPHKRRGRPLKGDEPRTSRRLSVTDSDLRVLRLAGNGNASEGLHRILAEYQQLPEPAGN